MRLTTALFSILLLAGCTNAGCPALKQYTIPQQQGIVKEWNALPPDSKLQSPLNDWERMRAACK